MGQTHAGLPRWCVRCVCVKILRKVNLRDPRVMTQCRAGRAWAEGVLTNEMTTLLSGLNTYLPVKVILLRHAVLFRISGEHLPCADQS